MRDITKLHPELQRKIGELVLACTGQGLKIGFSECVRTVEEQNALYAKGRTAPGAIVTNAKGSDYSSQHQWGIAADFYRNDGKGAFDNTDGFFETVGAIAKSIGLGWGGDWTKPKDRPHLYLPDWGKTPKTLKMQYALIEQVKHRTGKWSNAYIIGGYPFEAERNRLADMLGARLIHIDTSKEECLERLEYSEDGRDKKEWSKYIEDWWLQFEGGF